MIHQYKNNGFNMVLDVCSGAVHVVDDVVYDMPWRCMRTGRFRRQRLSESPDGEICSLRTTLGKHALEDIEELTERGACCLRRTPTRNAIDRF